MVVAFLQSAPPKAKRGTCHAVQGNSVFVDRRAQRPAVHYDQKGQSRRRRWRQLLRFRPRTFRAHDLQLAAKTFSSCFDMGCRHGAISAAFYAEIGRNRTDFAAYRRLGGVRRKLGADRRTMACSRSIGLLSNHGNIVDYPVETVG